MIDEKIIFDHKIDMSNLQHPSEHLTDNYRKHTNRNKYKLLDLPHSQHVQLMDNIRLTELWLDMDEATGLTLDRIGRNVLELRADRPDKEYRKAIKIKIRGNLSAGTIDDINDIAQILFEESYEGVQEAYTSELFLFEPAAIVLHLVNNIQDEYKLQDGIEFIDKVVRAGGVRLIPDMLYTDTFTTYVYHAGAVVDTVVEYFTERTEILTKSTKYTAVSGVLTTSEYITQSTPIKTTTKYYTAVSGMLNTAEHITEKHHVNTKLKTNTAINQPEILEERFFCDAKNNGEERFFDTENVGGYIER